MAPPAAPDGTEPESIREDAAPKGANSRIPFRDRFDLVLLLLIATLLLGAFTEPGVARAMASLLGATTAIMGAVVSGMWRRLGRVARVALVVLGLMSTGLAAGTPAASRGLAAFLVAAMFVVVTIGCIQRIFEFETVNLQSIFGILCVYLFIGLIFASLFSGTDGFTNTPSFSGDHPTDYGYASFVTLTTVGFGDVVPLTPFVRRLVVVEAIIGQMFLATTVARVVSLYDGSGRRARQRRDSDTEPGD